MLHANATRLCFPVRPKRTVPALPAAADTKAASASRNINILLPTVPIRVRCPGTAAADNIPTAFVRPGLTKGRTVVPNIILRHVPRSARWPIPTTAISAARLFRAAQTMQTVPTSPTALPKFRAGAAIPVIYSQETAA